MTSAMPLSTHKVVGAADRRFLLRLKLVDRRTTWSLDVSKFLRSYCEGKFLAPKVGGK